MFGWIRKIKEALDAPGVQTMNLSEGESATFRATIMFDGYTFEEVFDALQFAKEHGWKSKKDLTPL